MDYIREFDIRLEKEMYYAGETMQGKVVLDTTENFKVRAIRVLLRGKAHTEWKVMVSGDRRTVKDDQYFIDDRAVIWGKEKAEGNVPILPRGMHQFPFRFQLPESSLPCSFESRAGTIRYYLKVTVDIPYASPPQGMKYFTVISHLDCMEGSYLRPVRGETKRRRCCLCCESGRVSLRTDLERSAYVCGEALRVRADIDNQSEEDVRLKLRLHQYVEYYIDRGVLGVQKECSNTILEYRGAAVQPHQRTKCSPENLVVPTMPPTLIGVCRLIQIYYVLKVNLELEKSGEDLHMHFPITIATVPFRIPNSNQTPVVKYEVACDHAEGGMYIGPEFLLGQVYDGTTEFGENIVLYRPVYPTVKSNKVMLNNTTSINNSIQSQPQSSASTPNATKGLKVEVPKDLPIPNNQSQPQIHQKPGTSSASAPTNSKSTPSSTSNLITPTSTVVHETVSTRSTGHGNENGNKSSGKDPPVSSSSSKTATSSTVLPTIAGSTSAKTALENNAKKSSGEASQSEPVPLSDAQPKKLSSTQSTSGASGTSTSTTGVHLSFQASSSSSSAAKQSRTPSTSSSSGTNIPSKRIGDQQQVQQEKESCEDESEPKKAGSAALDTHPVSKIEEDGPPNAKGKGKDVVLPGKVVKLETPSSESCTTSTSNNLIKS